MNSSLLEIAEKKQLTMNPKLGQARQMFRLTSAEKRVIVFVLAALYWVLSQSVIATPIPPLFLRRQQRHLAGRDPETAGGVIGSRLQLQPAYLVCESLRSRR